MIIYKQMYNRVCIQFQVHYTGLGTQICTFTNIVLGILYILGQREHPCSSQLTVITTCVRLAILPQFYIGSANILHGWWLHRGPHKPWKCQN